MGRLDRLLRPRTIAVFGGAQAAAAVRQSLKMGFAGEIWPVHPSREEVEGLKTYRSVAELPGAPDAAFVGVNRHLTVEIVRDLRERGAGGAVCFASGFREAGEAQSGEALDAALLEAAGPMPIVGPNCYGVINYCDGALLWPDQHGGVRLREGGRGAAIVTQSSNIAVNMTMQARGLPLAYVMTAGNQAQTGLSEMALGLIEDERVSVLGLHIEAFDSVQGFERLAARARALGKPVVAMKMGRSELAREAAVSHTASLAGSDAAADAFLRRLGIARVQSMPAFLETLKLLHVAGPLDGLSVSSMSCSGGEAALMADHAAGRRARFRPLAPEHRARVAETLGPLVAIANPLDYHTFIWDDRPAMEKTFGAFVSGGFDFNFLLLDFPRGDRCLDTEWQSAVDAFAAALEANGARGAIVASMPENLPEGYCAAIMERGVVPLSGFTEALDAVEAAAEIGAAWRRPPADPVVAVNRKGPCGPSALDEDEAKERLAASALPVAPGQRAATVAEAIAASEIVGYPVAVKALGLAHKSERGAVRLNLRTRDEVEAAASALEGLGSGFLVERMVEDGLAELIAGVTGDPQFGPVMTVGSGGVLVELLADSRTLLLPATRAEIEEALRSLKLFALMDGYRGRMQADVEAAVTALEGIADFAVRHAASLAEMDINPLIVCPRGKGAWIADALIVMEEDGP
ncbi:acetate--CoA ligase family protein [Kaustia mangrovi]|uniref:Acetate--CoA ligase family protein n=1 Tax=Kaustia mangrovi TaxID=2593653 RepID=A0A7S8C3W5_9HYPH|nr:acetate--CoA ligase family protein [Kaustia mangrovi]QPC42881.1 acetate--CoA ligase family protein [Kaustia mangrovi]